MRKLFQSQLIVRSGFFCEYCGVDLLSHPRLFESFVLDHLWPKCRGGSDGAENRHVVCAACDRIKRDAARQTVEEARQFLSRFRIGLDRWFQRYRATFREEAVADVK
jgi:hypothetical protein